MIVMLWLQRKRRSRKKSENHASGLNMRSERGKSSKRHRHRNHHRGAQKKKNSIGNISDNGGKLNGNMLDNNAYYPQFVLSNQDYQNPDYADPRNGQKLIPLIPDYEKNYCEKDDLEKENTCKERRHRKHKNASSSRGEVSHTLKRTPSGNVVEYAQISKTSQKISQSHQSNKKRRRHSSEHSHGSEFSRSKSVGHYRARSQEPLVQSQLQQQSGPQTISQFPPQSHMQPYYASQSLNYANYSLPPPSHTLQQQQQYALSAQPTAAYNPTPSATAPLPPPHRPSHFNSSDFQTDSGAKIWMVRSWCKSGRICYTTSHQKLLKSECWKT